MMVEYIDTIANCVMALLAVVAFIVAFSEYCLHKRELMFIWNGVLLVVRKCWNIRLDFGDMLLFFVVMLNLPLPSIIYLGIRS